MKAIVVKKTVESLDILIKELQYQKDFLAKLEDIQKLVENNIKSKYVDSVEIADILLGLSNLVEFDSEKVLIANGEVIESI